MKRKLIRITTVPMSLGGLLTGQLAFMSDHFEVIGVSSKGEKNTLQKVGEKEGVKTVPIEMTRQITVFKDIIAVYNLYKLFKKEKPFIVHSHTPKAGTAAMLAAWLARVPHRLHTIAGLPLLEATGNKRVILNMVEKLTYKCATKIYPNSFNLEAIILNNKFTTKKKLKVIANGSSNGIDTNFYNPNLYDESFKSDLKKELKIAINDFVFVFVGRLVKDKGINELVAAFETLNKEFKSIKLLLVGDYEKNLDPLLPETLNIIKTNSNIIETGWVKDVRPYFSISNALTFPSYREGFPNVVMQAAAMQLPSIVTDINGCNEIITNKENGIIIPVKDELVLFEAMTYILNHKEEAKDMGLKSRELMRVSFERIVVWEAILEEYNQLQ